MSAAAAVASTSAARVAGEVAVAARRQMLATRGTWSSSWSEPLPQRAAGARPASTIIGDPARWAPAIALIALVLPGRR